VGLVLVMSKVDGVGLLGRGGGTNMFGEGTCDGDGCTG
jgi:hypothetical protein